MSNWYYRDGTIACDMSLPNWQEDMKKVDKLLGDIKYKRVAATELTNGYWVSTVWLGLDYNFFPNGKPLIFETMVFDTRKRKKYKIGKKTYTSNGEDVDMARYSTEEEALKGHAKMVKKWSKKK